MACIIGKVIIKEVSGGVINFGDVHTISPKELSKSISGAGGGGIGDGQFITNGSSVTNGTEPTVVDQNVIEV
ncbi:spore germination protein [Bacillus weihaiensis]|uniref:Spore germination protein n=1 Tax=Bacillus weihaiensis TaxID=1547283 RepID=A0A1L3MRT9_9BACI|nr:spore germination protein [Bacillus weihaiensis]APH05033.1 hypothetical protein A9C19_09885 [Bacillus weihaiensis]